ncbi:MAG: hypothetical protein JW891_08590 [Candidatus Lokiarchaeota archaeon]|nr:hypothetical protein [Candidatus Lokiarchaeota archaeon]
MIISTGGILSFIFLPPLLDSLGPIPRYVNTDWIDLECIANISKFHSTIGHGYPEEDQSTSDKHYFNPRENCSDTNDTIAVYAPDRVKVIKIESEHHVLSDGTIRGHQIHLESIAHPSITFVFFHINIESTSLVAGQTLNAGNKVGYCDCREGCNTDLAIFRGDNAISWFQVITDSLFETYHDRGIASRETMIKTAGEISNSTSAGYSFSNSDPSDWVDLSLD